MSSIELNLVKRYWEMLYFLSDDVKLRLASMLTSSVADNNEAKTSAKQDVTAMMVEKYAGALADDRSADEINAAIMNMRSSKKIQDFSL